VSDGSPRGIAQASRDREAVVALADRLNFATVSASDNHGWGRAAPAWSIMRIPGWRAMTPAQLDIAIRRTIIDEGPRAISVVARRTAAPSTTTVGAAIDGIMVAAVMLRTMDPVERISWLAWTWGLGLVAVPLRARDRRKQRRRRGASIRPTVRRAIDAAA
jgi:hypothetical protein